MTDEELIARWDDYVESMGSVMGEVENMAKQMRDRIETLVKERDARPTWQEWKDILYAGYRQKARVKRLEVALREIIDEDQHQSEWRYWEKEDGHWARKARAALQGDDHE